MIRAVMGRQRLGQIRAKEALAVDCGPNIKRPHPKRIHRNDLLNRLPTSQLKRRRPWPPGERGASQAEWNHL